MMQRVIRFFGSLWLTIPTLLLIAAVLVVGTKWGTDVTNGALRKDWYRSVPFNILLTILAINLITCTLIRKPWKIWMWGFLTTHTGILTIMFGAFLSFNFKINGTMAIEEGKSKDAIELEDERELAVQVEGDKVQTFDLDYSIYRASQPNEIFALRGGQGTLTVEKSEPHVEIGPVFDNTGQRPRNAAELALIFEDIPGESAFVEERHPIVWGGPNLIFSIGAVSDEGAALMATPAPAGSLLRLTIDGQSKELEIKKLVDSPAMLGKYRITIKEYFERIEEADPRITQSGPAVEFEVFDGQKTRGYMCFAQHPDLSPLDGETRQKGDFAATLIPALRESAFRLFLTPTGLRYLMTNMAGKKADGPARVGDKIRFPFMPKKLEIEIRQLLDHAEPGVKAIEPRENETLNPAVFVRLHQGATEAHGWIRFRDFSTFRLGEDRVHVMFRPKEYRGLNMRVLLEKFNKPTYQGSSSAALYESDLVVDDQETGHVIRAKSGVNYPFANRGWVFYQASFNASGARPVTFLQVSKDPGKKVVYLGAIITISGTVFMFYLKGFMLALYGLMQRADVKDPPLSTAASTFFFVLTAIGTPIGLLLFATTSWIGLAVAGVMVACDILGIAIALLLAARAKREGHAGLGWQIANLVASGWIVNTGALILILILRGT